MNGFSPLTLACCQGDDPEIALMLIKAGAHPSPKVDKSKMISPLMGACIFSNPKIIDALMEHDPTLFEITKHRGGLLLCFGGNI